MWRAPSRSESVASRTTGEHPFGPHQVRGPLEISGLLGVSGWTLGFVANIAVTVFAVALVSQRRLWRRAGVTVRWRGPIALAALAPLAFEALSWTLPAGIAPQDPGLALWAAALLLVGINEELISRGVILERLADAYRAGVAVSVTAVLFGLQHLSALVLTSRAFDDVALNVLLAGVYGVALAAYQLRFR